MLTPAPALPLPEDPLALSAPLALAWSRELCRHVDHSGENCAALHGLWQILRLLDFVASPRDHAEFFREAISPMARRGMRRVLVSGSADYAMPAVVSWVFETEGQRADVTVADVCQTPLRLCQWYANHTHRSFKCVASDIMEQAVGEPYDIICTHSFLGSFSADNRKQLVMKWQRLLPPGGAVVSVNRLRPDTVQAVGFNDTQARQFRERLAAAARAYPSDLGISATELASLADGYLRQRSIFPIRSTEEIQDLFADNGFRVAVMESGPITLAPGSVVGGPTLRDAAPYARFVAIRQ